MKAEWGQAAGWSQTRGNHRQRSLNATQVLTRREFLVHQIEKKNKLKEHFWSIIAKFLVLLILSMQPVKRKDKNHLCLCNRAVQEWDVPMGSQTMKAIAPRGQGHGQARPLSLFCPWHWRQRWAHHSSLYLPFLITFPAYLFLPWMPSCFSLHLQLPG